MKDHHIDKITVLVRQLIEQEYEHDNGHTIIKALERGLSWKDRYDEARAELLELELKLIALQEEQPKEKKKWAIR